MKIIFLSLIFSLTIGECLSGALCESDLISSALEIGFTRPILVTQESIGVSNKDLEKLIGQTSLLSNFRDINSFRRHQIHVLYLSFV